MDRVYFYTDPMLLDTQSLDEAFGPVPSSPTTRYRTTNIHSATAPAPAYAVCSGFIAVHSGQAADELCLLLKPVDPCFYDAKRIRLFIYKGIRKDSLVHGDGTHVADEGTNPLVDTIWSVHRSLELDRADYGLPPQERPEALGALGLGLLEDDDNPERFFYQRHPTFQPMLVRKGTELGRFKPGSFSVQIVLDTDGPLPNLGDLLPIDTVLAAADPSQPGSPLEQLQDRYQRKQVLAYLDACTFFARYHELGVEVAADGVSATLTGDELATTMLAKYASKSRWYLQLDEQIVQTAGEEANLAATLAFRHKDDQWQADYATYGWPIHLLDTANLNVAGGIPLIELELTLTSTTFKSLIGAVVAGAPADTYPRAPAGQERFFKLDTVDGQPAFPPLSLVLPNLSGGAVRCGYHHLVFKQRAAWLQPEHGPPMASTAANHPLHFLNHAFFPFRYRKSLLSDDAIVQNRFFSANQLFEAPGQLHHAQLAATGIAKDPSHILFLTIPLDQDWNRFEQQQEHVFLPEFMSSDTNRFLDLLNAKVRSVSISRTLRTLDDGTPFRQLTINYDNALRPSLMAPKQRLFVFGFTQAEFNVLIQIKDSSNFLNEDNVSLSFKTVEHRFDQQGQHYSVLEPFLCGYVLESGQPVNRFVPTSLRLIHYEP